MSGLEDPKPRSSCQTVRSESPLGHKPPNWRRAANFRSALDCVAKLRLRRLANRDSVGLRRHLREQRMLGRQESGQGQFFYSFDLDKVVRVDHLVRQIDGFLA
ncbi:MULTISPECIES: hypothetical protein [unclassified Bradyrhizobium]|uniref:hypothetical protein n=1 Tax=unclassified Bradyrhizobium TaxID=2631580 RepID=UPI001FF9BC9F|nr:MULTISPECIES: hypothetical protein [unclassified Bradyrhizobium]